MAALLNSILKLSWLEMKLYMRHSIAVWWTFCVPIIILFILGIFLQDTMKEYYGPILIPGLCTTVLLSSSIMGLMPYLVSMREARVYEILLLLGMNRIGILSANIISRSVLSVIQIVILFILGAIFFPGYGMIQILQGLPLILGTILFGVLLFFQISAILSMFAKTGTGANTLASVVFYPLILFGGCYYDISVLML